MKKQNALILAVIVVFLFTACGKTGVPAVTVKDEIPTTEAPASVQPSEGSAQPTAEVTPAPTPTPVSVQKLPGTTGNYFILCETVAQKQCLSKFVAYKEQSGYTVTVKSVEEDVKFEAESDSSLEIQQYLKDMDKELSLEYVLLVGDPYRKEYACPEHTGGIIPMRYLYWNSGNHNTRYCFDGYDYRDPENSAFNTPADMFYAIDLKWDYDKDGYAGENNEIKRAIKKSKPVLLFLLGRVPFSAEADITAALDATMQYLSESQEQSNALVATGIISYPQGKKYPYTADCAVYADVLAKNLVKNDIETTTMFEKSGVVPSKFDCTIPLSQNGFAAEFKKGSDLAYTFGHGGYYTLLWNEDTNKNEICDEQLSEVTILTKHLDGQTGFLFMDGCHTMRVETDTDSIEMLHFQDLLKAGTAVAGIATTRDSGFNPRKPAPRLVSLMFTHGSLIVSSEFYQSAIEIIKKDSDLAYVYCYLGDPSIALRS